jgi:hypothetical protein
MYRTMISALVGLNLILGSASAVSLHPDTFKQTVDKKIPAAPGSAIFVNVKRIFGLYGDLITKSPQWESVAKQIEQGCPDPSKDLDEVAVSLDLAQANTVGGVITGRIDKIKLLAFAAANGVTLTPSVNRGVAIMTAKHNSTNVQLGFVDYETTLFSSDNAGAHEPMNALISTLKGEIPSFGEATETSLPANYLALASVKVPQEIVDQYGTQVPPALEPVKHIKVLSLSVEAQDSGDGSATLAATCDTEANAKALGAILEELRQQFGSSGMSGSDLLNRLKVSVTGKVAKLELSITKAELEEIFAR